MMRDISPKNNQRPTLSMPHVVSMAFYLYRKTFLITMPAALLLFMICFGLYSWLLPTIVGMPTEKFVALVSQNDTKSLTALISSKRFLITSNVFILLISCLVAPISAGFYEVFQKTKENTPIATNRVFVHYNSAYTGRILGYTILIWAAKQLLSLLLLAMNIPMFGFWMHTLLAVFFTLTIPYIVLQDNPLMIALKNSFKTVAPYLFLVFVSLVVGVIFGFLGILLCGIGIATTLPFLYAVNYVLFEFLKR